jgi:hypothetical protein
MRIHLLLVFSFILMICLLYFTLLVGNAKSATLKMARNHLMVIHLLSFRGVFKQQGVFETPVNLRIVITITILRQSQIVIGRS